MAIKPGYKTFTFDGERSGDYNTYITGSAVYNAPEREVEMIEIPGRSGAFALDKGRFENIEVTYPAGIYAESQEEFAEALSDLRNMLCSRRGYCRLEDEYNPDEYRMAVYKSGLDVDPAAFQKAGEFEITFDCKPQRWLVSGEEAITIGDWRETETVTGDIVQIDNSRGVLNTKSLTVSLEPIQAGSGTPSPDNVRPISGRTEVETVVSPTTSAEDGDTYTTALGRTVYGGTLDVVSGELVVDRAMVTLDGTNGTYSFLSSGRVNIDYADLGYKHEVNATIGMSNLYAEVGQKGTNSQFNTLVASMDGVFDFNNSPSASAIRIKDSRFTSLDTAKGLLAETPLQLVYELATPQTIQLSGQDIALLLGNNNVWSDGTITLEYGELITGVDNPTLFEASPLLEVEGYGTINMNGHTIEIDNAVLGVVEIASASGQTFPGLVTEQLPYSITKTIDYSNYSGAVENGDSLFIDAIQITTGAFFEYLSVKGATPTPTITADIGNATASGTVRNVEVLSPGGTVYIPEFSIIASIANIELTAFTNESYAATITAPLKDTTNQTLRTLVINVSIENHESGILEVVFSFTGSAGTFTREPFYCYNVERNEGGNIKLAKSYIYSTQSILGNPLYLDCDLGEAYKIEAGEVISLNQHIDLGSKLPTLSPGANVITYDNTITDLKVIPRWWKV